MIKNKNIYIYDSTLRDGAQTKGVDFSLSDKIAIAKMLDKFGLDYIEGGWPGANNTDTEFFKKSPRLKKSKLVSFGMTYKNLNVLKKKFNEIKKKFKVKTLCIVGKTWDFQVKQTLNITEKENLTIIKKNIEVSKNYFEEILFDAEHFFDGFKSKKEYALECLKSANVSGARWIVLCDTNGGTLPNEIEEIVKEVTQHVPQDKLGIHCHNDTENAVANSLAAVRSGVRQIQGTFNGLGERCGNANLTSVIPTLILKSVSPSLKLISLSVPSIGEGTSKLTLSVSNSTTGSSALIFSPVFFNHFETVASVILSPNSGTKIFSLIFN